MQIVCWLKMFFAFALGLISFTGSFGINDSILGQRAKAAASSPREVGRPATRITSELAFNAGFAGASGASAQYGRKIIIAAPAFSAAKIASPAVVDLVYYLGMMTGVDFATDVSPAASAIILMLAASPIAPSDAAERLKGKGIESFLIRGDNSRLEIIANDEHGLANGIYFYLERLGVRWLLPSDKWTVIPTRSNVTLSIDQLVEPAYKVRGYFGTGGFYSYRWGRSYPGSAAFEARTLQWQRRLRYGGEYTLGKSMGEGFIADKKITPILEAHPEYLAKIHGQYSSLYTKDKNGKSELNIIAKLNAGNPGAVALFCDWVIDKLKAASKSPDKSLHSVVSVEPSDGFGYGDNVSELPGDGSASDQTFFIANACAKRVRTDFPNASVILLAYGGHAAPPSFPLEPNVIVQVTPYAFQGTRPERFIAQWKEKAKKLAIYDYWSIPDWTHDEPDFNYLRIGQKLRYWRANKIEGLNAESTYGAGAMGLGHYVSAHLMWDLGLDEHALIEDWYEKAFGPATAPMKRMLERWARSFKLISAELGASFYDINEAAQLAAGNPAVAARVDDYARYLQYLRLRLELNNATDGAIKTRIADKLAEHLLNIDDSSMVHTTRIIDLDTRPYPPVVAGFDLSNPASPGPGWVRIHPLSHHDVEALIADGRKSYQPTDWDEKTYFGELTPLQSIHWTTPNGDPWGTIMPTISDLDLDLEIPAGLNELPLRVTKYVENEITLFDAEGRAVFSTKVEKDSLKGFSSWEEMAIPLAPGHYKIHFHPTGGRANGYFNFQTWKGVPLILHSFLSPKQTPSPQLYFYVPHGLKKIVMFYELGDYNGVFHFQVLGPNGENAQIDFRDNRRILEINVPPGQDGQIWSLINSVSPNVSHEMLNLPQGFSLSREVLMVPSDVIGPH